MAIRALSVRQPYVELILRGLKRAEYRNRPTNIRRKIYLYASLRPGDEDGFRQLRVEVGGLPTGMIVGTAVLTNCLKSKKRRGTWEWHLRQPKRLKRPFKPTKQPQPAWFYPL